MTPNENKSLTVRIPKDLHQRLKVVQAYDGRSLQEVLALMLEAWVDKQEKALKDLVKEQLNG